MVNRLAAHLNSFRGVDLDVALAASAAAGYDAVELCAAGDTGVLGHRAVEAALARHGLTALALSAHSDLTTDEGLSAGVAGVAWAADHGLGLVTTAIGGDLTDAHHGARDAVVANLAALARAAEARGVLVALELHGAATGSGALARPWVEAVASPHLGIKYDTANCEYYAGVRAVDDLPQVLDLVVNVDAKDKRGGVGVWDFPPAGDGHIDWPRLVAILRRAGYTGPMTVEVEFQGEPWPGPDEVAAALRRAAATLRPLLA